MTIKECVRKYAKELKDITHIPNKEVEILILHILQKNIIWLHLHSHEEFKQEKELAKLVKKRATDFPMEYITNRASFYGESFIVKQNVLIPRPETEILVENAFNILKDIPNPKIIEVGIGSGIISVMIFHVCRRSFKQVKSAVSKRMLHQSAGGLNGSSSQTSLKTTKTRALRDVVMGAVT